MQVRVFHSDGHNQASNKQHTGPLHVELADIISAHNSKEGKEHHSDAVWQAIERAIRTLATLLSLYVLSTDTLNTLRPYN
jgi:hypothetical protein